MPTIYDRLLLAKIEVTKGTDSVPVVGTNAIRIRSGKISHTQDAVARAAIKQTMGNLAHLVGKQTVQLEVEVDLHGSGAAGTAPEFGALLQACGLLETIVPATSAAYDPATTGHKSLSMYWYEDGLLWKLLGAVGKCSFNAQIGAAPTLKFTFMAAYAAPTAVSCPTGAVYQSAAPIVMSSADVINDGAAIKVGAFSLEDGNDVQHHYTTSQNEFVVANRQPKLKLTKDSISTAAEWTALNAGTTASLSATFGATAGSRLVLTAPVAKREGVAIGQRADRNTLEVSYGLFESTGDDQFKFLFN
jgi:hypothetical protein